MSGHRYELKCPECGCSTLHVEYQVTVDVEVADEKITRVMVHDDALDGPHAVSCHNGHLVDDQPTIQAAYEIADGTWPAWQLGA